MKKILKNNYIVYEHVNNINNKKYIGITCQTLVARCGKHGQNYKNKYFKNAINKYGWDNFAHNILYENLSKDDAKKKEIELIEKYNATDREFGYNISKGGDTGSGLYGESHPLYNVHKYGKDAPNYGKKHSFESKLAMSEAHKKMIGELNPFYNKHHTEETKEKIRNKNINRFMGGDNFHAKAVINLNTNKIFNSIIDIYTIPLWTIDFL